MDQALRNLHPRLVALEVRESPFAQLRALPARGVHWVPPALVAKVSFAGWAQAGRVRHAAFHGLRKDKPAQPVVRERAQPLASPAAVAPAAATPPAPAPAAASTCSFGVLPRCRSGQVQVQVQAEGLAIAHPGRMIDTASGTTKPGLAHCCAAGAPRRMERLPGMATIAPGTHAQPLALLEVARAQELVPVVQRNVSESPHLECPQGPP